MAGSLDVGRLKAMVIELWGRGGMDTPLKVMPWGTVPAPGRMAGYCTSFKYVVGRTPSEMEDILGFASGTKLALGAEIYVIDPLPTAAQFELRGYTHLPGGVATNDPSYRADLRYPPGLGAPQWELTGYPQSGLQHIATVGPEECFSYPVAKLPQRVLSPPAGS
jgi:hypothetical protein